MDTARVLVILNSSFTFHDSLIHKDYTVPNVESQVFTPNMQCLSSLGINPGEPVCQANVRLRSAPFVKQ